MVFIESRVFSRRLSELAGKASEEILFRIQGELLRDPVRGDVIPGAGGVRKARTRNPVRGKGTRGGYRYLFLYVEHKQHIHLLYLLDKDEQEDLSPEERKAVRLLVEQIKRV